MPIDHGGHTDSQILGLTVLPLPLPLPVNIVSIGNSVLCVLFAKVLPLIRSNIPVTLAILTSLFLIYFFTSRGRRWRKRSILLSTTQIIM